MVGVLLTALGRRSGRLTPGRQGIRHSRLPGYTGNTVSAYTTQSRDTAPDAERLQLAIWRRMSAEEKLRIVGELCDSVRYLAEMGLRERHPDASDDEIRMRLFSTWLDRRTMIQCYGWDPLGH